MKSILLVVAIWIVSAWAAPGPGGSSFYDQGSPDSSSEFEIQGPVYSYAAPVSSYVPLSELKKPIVPILHFNFNNDHQGTFNFESVSGDGTLISEEGNLKGLRDGGEGAVRRGTYSYLGDDGYTYSVTWAADENGFRASGDHLPIQSQDFYYK